jgi:hypothetical protein
MEDRAKLAERFLSVTLSKSRPGCNRRSFQISPSKPFVLINPQGRPILAGDYPYFGHSGPEGKVTLWVQTERRGHLLGARSVSLWSMQVDKLLKSLVGPKSPVVWFAP